MINNTTQIFPRKNINNLMFDLRDLWYLKMSALCIALRVAALWTRPSTDNNKTSARDTGLQN